MSADSVFVHGYQPVGDQRVAQGSIVIEGHFPDSSVAAVRDAETYKQWERHEREKFITDAQAIFGVLSNNLPGGTLHKLLILMLQHKVNLYVVKE